MARSRKKQRNNGLAVSKKALPLIIIGVGGLLVAAAALLVFGRGNQEGTPNLVLDQEVFDYGEVAFNTPITSTFVLHNEGTAPLRILGEPQVEIREGC